MNDKQGLAGVEAPPEGLPVAVDLIDRTREYVEASRAPNTTRTYDSAWRSFCRWCVTREMIELPATPETVAMYLTDKASTLKASSLAVHTAAIAQAHRTMGHESPTTHPLVQRVTRGIRRTHGMAPTTKAALTTNDVKAMVSVAGDDLRGLRDVAVLLVGFAGGLRRSEICALNLGDLTFRPDGVAVRLRRSKTDPEGRGRTVPVGFGSSRSTCPVVALRRWIAAGGIAQGALFRGVDRHSHVRGGRLTGGSIARIVKRLGAEVGLDPATLAGHSLRRGTASEAARRGASERQISRVTGHRSLKVLRGYIDEGTLMERSLVRSLGL